MSADKPKWHIRKRDGVWKVRKPNGTHFGTYYTHAEAPAQAIRRPTVATAGVGGYLERARSWDYDARNMPFGFAAPTAHRDEDHQ